MPPRAARKKKAIPAVLPVAGGSILEQLPAELNQSIFDLLYISDEFHQPDLIRPLSKHLLPFSTAALYCKIAINVEGKFENDLGDLCVSISGNAALGQMVQALSFEQDEDSETNTVYESHYHIRMVENLLLSLKNLKRLEVFSWDMVGKVVLSSRFGREGGKAMESIRMVDCFGSIKGSLTEAWSHLRHLPVLSTIDYHNKDPSIAAEAAIPTKLGGFEKVTRLQCYLNDFSSSHAVNFASLFPSTLQQIKLIHLNEDIRPNYSPFLDSLSPDSITSIELNTSPDLIFTNLEQFPVHQSLTRFPRLHDLKFCDARIFDSELIEAIHGLNLTSLYISFDSHLSYDLMHQLLSGIKKDSNLKYVGLGIAMKLGTTGRTYRDGAELVVRNGNLVPGEGWERPDWSIITLPEARELERISIEKGITLVGGTIEGLKVERAFEEEEKWLDYVMKVTRGGPVECKRCDK